MHFFRSDFKNHYALIASFNAFPALNFGFLDAAIVMVSPLLGFLPSLSGRSATSKVPKPTNCTLSPAFNAPSTTAVKASIAFSASTFFNPACSATAATNSVHLKLLLTSHTVRPAKYPLAKTDFCFLLHAFFLILHIFFNAFLL